jgi:DNA-binding transcriptional LysR family regulator
MSVRVEGRVTASANEGAIAAAVAGLGIVSSGFLGCRTELASGTLIEILSDWRMDPIEIHALFPAARVSKPSARVFADYLADMLRE